MKTELNFRFAVREDTPLILQMIRELADYEKLLDEVVATEPVLEEWLFDRQKAEVLFVLTPEGKEAGFALFFHNFSTFLGRAGIYLEDLYVRPEYRGRGYGKGLIRRLAALAVERGCGRLEWQDPHRPRRRAQGIENAHRAAGAVEAARHGLLPLIGSRAHVRLDCLSYPEQKKAVRHSRAAFYMVV